MVPPRGEQNGGPSQRQKQNQTQKEVESGRLKYHTIPYSTIQYPTLPHNTLLYHTIPYSTIHYHKLKCPYGHLSMTYRLLPVPGEHSFRIFSLNLKAKNVLHTK